VGFLSVKDGNMMCDEPVIDVADLEVVGQCLHMILG
jgi:hypothetical protein